MKTNILYLDNAFWKTDLEEWPEKPDGWTLRLFKDKYEAEADLAEARTHLTPIVQEDQKWIKYLIYENNPIVSLDGFRKFEPVNGTIYKDTGIELEEVIQVKRGDGKWFASLIASEIHIKEYPSTYRKAYRIEEGEQPKEEIQAVIFNDFLQRVYNDDRKGYNRIETALELQEQFHITRKTL